MADRPRFEPVDGQAIVDKLVYHFGIAPSVFEGFVWVRPSRRYLVLLSAEADGLETLNPFTAGLPFVRMGMKAPKPTTAAACWLMKHARRNIMNVRAAQAAHFMARRSFQADPTQQAGCTGGYVLIRHGAFPLGLGHLHVETGDVSSYVPKHVARSVDAGPVGPTSFDEEGEGMH